jgi:uncharacterized protein YqfB (UPF0267 family)
MNAFEASKKMYVPPDVSVFPETVEVADYIKSHSDKNDSIVVMGSEPQIYFYLNHIAPTGFIYFFFLTEKHPYTEKMREEFIKKVEAAAPAFIVYSPSWISEFTSNDEKNKLLNWCINYQELNYNLVGVANIVSRKKTEYRWNDEANSYVPPFSLCALFVFERKTHKYHPKPHY